MSKMWEDIKDFHKMFSLPQNELPSVLNKELYDFRYRFMYEELGEFEDAHDRGDVVKAFDALLDLVYVAMGTAYMMNVPWDEGWSHVQYANMTKKRAEKVGDSKRGSTFDVVKPEGWVAPDAMIEAEINIHENMLLLAKHERMIIILEKIMGPINECDNKDGDA